MASFKTEDQHCCIACFQLLTMDLKQIPHFYLSNVWCWAQDSVCRLGLSGTEDSFYTEGRLYISELDLSKRSTCIIYMMMICSPLYSQYYMTIVFSFFSLKKKPLDFHICDASVSSSIADLPDTRRAPRTYAYQPNFVFLEPQKKCSKNKTIFLAVPFQIMSSPAPMIW